MANRLAAELSPYLQQHAENPVDWHAWGQEALESAKRLDRPIFLSIGYAACHWCHVMAHETFEDPALAARLNDDFISIKVDREERPDLDAIYMDAVVALTGQGGWPMSVFLTPEGEPFFGGTYFPAQPRHGLPSFGEVIEGVARLWREDRPGLQQAARRLSEHLRATHAVRPGADALDPGGLDRASQALFHGYDWQRGGWGGAPKFPQPLAIEFLLQRSVRRGDLLARDLALHALTQMSRGGLFDQLGGGFHRYAVDASWTVPHFEKMLYDNALLARAYLHAWQISPSPELHGVFQQTLEFLLTEMRLPGGGYAASLDADSDGEEGRYYTWSVEQIESVLGRSDQARAWMSLHGVSPAGNFEGRSVLTRAADRQAVAGALDLPRETLGAWDEEARLALLARRRGRARPARDEKILTNWNSLVLQLLAESARAFPARGYLAAAEELAEFLTTALRPGGGLMHVWRDGRAAIPGFLDDHAGLALGLLALYQTDADPRWMDAACQLAETIDKQFADQSGRWCDVRAGDPSLLIMPRSLQDSPTPSGGALATLLFAQLHAFTGTARYAELAAGAAAEIQHLTAEHPTAFAAWLTALDLCLDPPAQLAIVGPPGTPGLAELIELVSSRYWPDLVLATSPPTPSSTLPLLAGREMLAGRATAYLCREFVCQLPTTEAHLLEEQLEGLRPPQQRNSPPGKPGESQPFEGSPPGEPAVP